jgi:hypothetical protein
MHSIQEIDLNMLLKIILSDTFILAGADHIAND